MQNPATPGQLRFFVLDMQQPRPAIVHRLAVSGAHGTVDADRLAGAVRAVLLAQPALRVSLHMTADGLVQRVHPVADVPFDVRPLPADDGAADRVLAGQLDALGAPFDHAGAPLCRVVLLHRADRAHLLFAVHHGVFDDGSAPALLASLTTAHGLGPEQLPAAQSPSFDLSGHHLATLRDFWTTTLKDAPDNCTLPQLTPGADRTRAEVATRLPDDLTDRMRRRTALTGASPFTQVMSAFAWVAGWYGSTDDVVIATVSGAHRDAQGVSVVGCLQNTVPVRVDLAGATTEDLLERTLDALSDAVDHAELPIEDILAATGAPRHPDGKPFTQLICTQGELATEAVDASGLRWLLEPPVSDQVEYDLSVTLLHAPDGAQHLVVAHPESALDARVAERFLAHLVAALDALGADEHRPLTEHDLLTPAERAELAGLAAPAPAVTGMPVHRLVEARAAARPSAAAVRTAERQLDHAEVTARAQGLAAALIEAGVRPGDRVGIHLDRSPDLVTAILATWWAGAAYVPLDPDHPAERLRYVLHDAEPAALIATAPLLPGIPTVAPDARAAAPAAWPRTAADAPAYVMYTSGSTGRPKGAVVRHDSLCALFAALDTQFAGGPSVVLAATGYAFDISLVELVWPLTCGRTLHLTSHRTVVQDLPDPAGAFYQCTPSAARLHTASPQGRRFLSRLGALLLGGEPLDADLAADLAGLVPGPVLNGYGPTEATVYTTFWRVVPHAPVRIGLPLPGVRCHVVDPHGRDLPPGCPGELLISGTGVGDGYWRRPELTAERFPVLPGAMGATGYRSGDLVSFSPGAGLAFLHRADQQVKVLGQRVETGEIEATLRRQTGVRDAAVALLPDRTGVVAFVVPDGAEDVESGLVPRALPAEAVSGLRRETARWLTGAMLPTAWFAVAELPRSPNGKLDRQTLAGWAADSAPAPHPAAPVTGSAAQAVTEVWERILGAPVTDAGATFFALGGTSSGVLRALAQLRPRYPRLHVADLFRHTTVRGLADFLDHLDAPAEAPPADTGRGARRARALSRWAGAGRR
ncbi:amino acid adenylation domain-containing protein [Streptomyces sp. NPDC004232]|uniref:non-ribosomal peptide synthetase n=1 Tax=Streptomyces sp. NPDC004232 TaxID=3154454 RepID=UPI001DCEB80A|nr:amino acid adenylation domain-containing protein [Streptomyces sp. tea 10]